MKIRYIGERKLEIAGARPIVVEPGEEFEVGERLGESLLAQERKFVKAVAPKPRRSKPEDEESQP